MHFISPYENPVSLSVDFRPHVMYIVPVGQNPTGAVNTVLIISATNRFSYFRSDDVSLAEERNL